MWDIFIFSIKMMFKNKVRSLLTMLGIIVGILSLIVIVVMGNSFSETFTSITNTLYKNDQMFVDIVPTDNNKTVVYNEYGSPVVPESISFDIRDVNTLLEEKIEGNSYLSIGGGLEQSATGNHLGRNTTFMVIGSCSDEVTNSALNIISGRDISRADERNYASTALISDVAANYLFNEADPLGQELIVKIGDSVVPVVVVGIYKYQGIINYDDMSSMVSMAFINHTYLENKFSELLDESYWNSDSLTITLKDVEDKEEFKKDLAYQLDNLLNQEKWTVELYSLSENINSTKEIVDIILKVVFVIACISLLIGGIGIMNVMLITVTERTNEIGARKALGATDFLIIFQFLCESFVISLSGTILGVTSGMLISKVIAEIVSGMLQVQLKIPVQIDVSIPIGMLIFSILSSIFIGVVFGLYPARKAVKMQVVDALRYE